MARKSTTASAPKAKAPEPKSAEQARDDENVVTIEGRLVADPVLRKTQNGKSVSTIRIAVDHPGDETTFHYVVVWNRTAEVVCQFKRKGHPIEVVGRVQERTYKPENAEPRTITEISAFRVQFLPVRRQAETAEKEVA
jgi:single-strand DNA-binding protein